MKNRFIPHPTNREYLTLGLLLLEVVIFSIFARGFITVSNLQSIVQNSAEISLISIGMTLVMVQGGIDLSVGSMMGILAILAGRLFQNGVHALLIMLATILAGAVLGMFNGAIITKFNIPELVATIGTNNVFRMFIFILLGGQWITGLRTVMTNITKATIGPIPLLLLFMIGFYFLFYYLTMRTRFGRQIYAVGSNYTAAQLVGIKIKRVKLSSYVIMGMMVGLASLLYIGRMGSVEMSIGIDTPLQCIAAVTIGGTSVTGKGSKGTLIGTLAGVFFIAVMRNGIVLLGIPSLLENFFIGLLIILSSLLDYLIVSQRSRRNTKLILRKRT